MLMAKLAYQGALDSGSRVDFSFSQKFREARGRALQIRELAFADGENGPAGAPQSAHVLGVPKAIALKFRAPIIEARLWHSSDLAVSMLMPKAAVDENYFAITCQDNVGCSRQCARVEPVSTPKPKHDFPDNHLRPSMLRLYLRH